MRAISSAEGQDLWRRLWRDCGDTLAATLRVRVHRDRQQTQDESPKYCVAMTYGETSVTPSRICGLLARKLQTKQGQIYIDSGTGGGRFHPKTQEDCSLPRWRESRPVSAISVQN